MTRIPKLGQTPEWFFNREHNGAKTAIIKSYQARFLSESEYRINRSFLNPTGKKGVFEWDTIGGETVFSHLYLFAHGKWLVKYRFTYPSKYHTIIGPEIEKLITTFKWP
jgi:hypothetical protein